jgi:type I restriction-modification system DNA methylase subunit
LKKRNNNTYKSSQKEEPKYIQYAFFDLEASDSAIPSIASGADHTVPQDSQIVDIKPENVVDNTAHDTKGFFTPKEIINLMVGLLDPQPETTVYDPCCGSGAFLIAALQRLEKKYPGRGITLFGQEPNPDLCAQARIMLSQQSNTSVDICEGDALQSPKFSEQNNSLMRFDYIIANPPWNMRVRDGDFHLASHKGRFEDGIPTRFADWGWIQHILFSPKKNGCAAILTSVGAITRGLYTESGSEQKIRIKFILRDCIEAVVRLPDNLFLNTSVPGMLLLLNRKKLAERQNQILEIDASQLFTTAEGQPKKRLTQEGIDAILDVYEHWEPRENFSKVITIQEAKKKRYNLNPSVYNKPLPRLAPLEEIRRKLEPIQVEHRHIYTEIAAMLDNQHIAESVLSGKFDIVISQILDSLLPHDKLPGIAILRQYVPRLQFIVQQEITLEEEHKQSLMHGFFTDPTLPSERLGNITTISSGGNPSSKDKGLYGDEFCWVQIQDLNNGMIKSTAKMLSKAGVFAIAPEAKLRGMKTTKGGENVVVEELLRKIDTVLGVPAATNVEVCCIDPRPERLLPAYLIYYIIYIRHTWAEYASQTRKEPRINNAIISDTQIALPLIEKQQEIVDKLQAIDTRISMLKSEKGYLNTL